MYDKLKAFIKLDKVGPTFDIHRGVKQGYPLSPNLFNCIIEEIFWEMGWEGIGGSSWTVNCLTQLQVFRRRRAIFGQHRNSTGNGYQIGNKKQKSRAKN